MIASDNEKRRSISTDGSQQSRHDRVTVVIIVICDFVTVETCSHLLHFIVLGTSDSRPSSTVIHRPSLSIHRPVVLPSFLIPTSSTFNEVLTLAKVSKSFFFIHRGKTDPVLEVHHLLGFDSRDIQEVRWGSLRAAPIYNAPSPYNALIVSYPYSFFK